MLPLNHYYIYLFIYFYLMKEAHWVLKERVLLLAHFNKKTTTTIFTNINHRYVELHSVFEREGLHWRRLNNCICLRCVVDWSEHGDLPLPLFLYVFYNCLLDLLQQCTKFQQKWMTGSVCIIVTPQKSHTIRLRRTLCTISGKEVSKYSMQNPQWLYCQKVIRVIRLLS